MRDAAGKKRHGQEERERQMLLEERRELREDDGGPGLEHEERQEPGAAAHDEVADLRAEIGLRRSRARHARHVLRRVALELDHDLARRQRADEGAVAVDDGQRARPAEHDDARERVVQGLVVAQDGLRGLGEARDAVVRRGQQQLGRADVAGDRAAGADPDAADLAHAVRRGADGRHGLRDGGPGVDDDLARRVHRRVLGDVLEDRLVAAQHRHRLSRIARR